MLVDLQAKDLGKLKIHKVTKQQGAAESQMQRVRSQHCWRRRECLKGMRLGAVVVEAQTATT